MTTLAVPYYGHLYHQQTGYERVYFIINYDMDTERPQEIRLGVWDTKRTPEFDNWLKENGVFGLVCRDADSVPLLEKIVKKGIMVLGQSSRCAQNVMKNLFLA